MLPALLGRLRIKSAILPIAREKAFCEVGDIHGSADLLTAALLQAKDLPIVCVGDHVGRGDRLDEILRILLLGKTSHVCQALMKR